MDHFPSMKGLDLTADQKAKVKDPRKEYEPKFEDLRKAREAVFTADQKKARDEARDKAKEAGKNRWEAQRAGREAMKITDDQKAKLKEIRTKVRALRRGDRQGERDPDRRAKGQTRKEDAARAWAASRGGESCLSLPLRHKSRTRADPPLLLDRPSLFFLGDLGSHKPDSRPPVARTATHVIV